MTTVVGIVTKEGVVLASDKRATEGYVVASRQAEKIIPITDNIAIAAAGAVADMQHIVRILKANIKLKELRSGKKATAKEVAHLLSVVLYSKRFYFFPYLAFFIVGGWDGNGYAIYHLDAFGSVIKEDRYFAEGSGMMFALGVLEAEYKEDITLDEAEKLAEKAVRAAIKRDIGSGDGIEIVKIKDRIEKKFIPLVQL